MTLTRRFRRFRRFRQLLIPLTAGIIVVDATLWAPGVLNAVGAIVLFLAIELPLGLIVIALLAREYWRARKSGLSRREAFARWSETEPLIRLILSETANLNSLWMLARGKRVGVDGNNVELPYAKGTFALPIAFLVATIIEVAVLHLVIPWAWVRLVALIVSVYSVILVLGYLASRVVHPHLLSNDYLTLRAGLHVVTRIPRGHIDKVIVVNRYKHACSVEEDGRLSLASGQAPMSTSY